MNNPLPDQRVLWIIPKVSIAGRENRTPSISLPARHRLSGIAESNWRLHLGRVAYYHYTNPAQAVPGNGLSGMPDLNRRPPAPKAGALANCANPRNNKFFTHNDWAIPSIQPIIL